MKKLFFSIFAIFLMASNVCAQIQLYPYPTGDLCTTNEKAVSIFSSRLKSVISRNGMISSDIEGRFVLAAKVDILHKEITKTAPQQHVLSLLVTYAVGDGYMGMCFGSTEVEVKGVGPSEELAFLNALKNLKPTNPEVAKLCQVAQGRILDYFESMGKKILNEAKAKVDARKYEEACSMLYAIPMECSHYNAACAIMSQALKGYANLESARAVNQAEAMWSGDPSQENAEAVMEMILDVDPASPAYAQANALKKKVEGRIITLQDQERTDRIAAEKREYKLERQRISEEGKTSRAVANAAAQVASAYYDSHRVTYHVHSWW